MNKKLIHTFFTSSKVTKIIYDFGIGLAIVIKLFLIKNYDIVADPFDPENYLARAAKNLWFSKDISIGNLNHPPGYSIFVWLFNLSGIPLRLCHEIFYILSVLLLVYCIRLLKIPKLVCFFTFLLFLFHPLTVRFFNDARSEAVSVSLFNILFSLLILLFLAKRRSLKISYSCLSGFLLGIISITRPEKEVLYLYLLCLGILVWISSVHLPMISKIKKIAYFILIPFSIFLIVNFSIASLNYAFLGVPAVSLYTARSYKGMYTKLTKINAGTPQQYIPINQAQLEAASSVSPTFKKLNDFLPKQEIPSDQTGWQLVYAARQSINDKSPRKIYELITKIDTELGIALNNKLLPSKPFTLGYLDPNIQVWMPYLNQSFSKVFSTFVFPPISEVEKIITIDDPRASQTLFNSIANRRAYLINREINSSKRLLILKILTFGIYIINLLGLISFGTLLIYSLIARKKSLFFSIHCVIILLFLCTMVGRLILYTLVDVTAWKIPYRYLFPSMPLFSGLSLLNTFVMVNLFVKKRKCDKSNF